ncbi:MAG: tautomerase family protein [Acidimicrobiia bacterium]
MPFLEVTLTEGRDPDLLRKLMGNLTNTVVETLDAPIESVRVVLREVPPENWCAGGVTIAERRAKTG